ncbi:NAD(P)-dependent alcohol dehydrogenase [Arthrobacter sp. zg-Y750]|uniref:NAD(P)-dependent alcohol dehydrogenase n=1 Tax=Arthrobacter sp. zg-Y750 TaxID=2894189 RepID=UPI001E581A35|nr:NAD(P)-dependent alcohol dehydrogenase [Arthrobacter sp. zg-Y750]MCC9176660.1 NAD(P)-dependent alcohol dehydrogenase [Arthrobacter sp. zg-Y750]
MSLTTSPASAVPTPDLPATMRVSVLRVPAAHPGADDPGADDPAAAAGTEHPNTLTVEERPVPQPGAGEVLVRVAAVGVCGSDVHYYRHGRIGPFVVEDSLVLGHEASGTVAAVGPGVDPERIGQRVSIEPQKPCRKCGQCKQGRYNLCPDMAFYATPPVDGAFAEYVVIEADFAHPVPDSVSDEAAALLEPLSVGIWACQKAGIGPGQRLLVAGAGPVGVIIAQVARAFGASAVYVSDISRERLDFAAGHGATHTLHASQPVDRLGADAFIDASGAPSAVRAGIRAVAPGGRAVLVGMGADDAELPVSVIQNRELWVTGVFRYANTWPTAISLAAEGRVDLDALVTDLFGLGQVAEALDAGRRPETLKALVQPWR